MAKHTIDVPNGNGGTTATKIKDAGHRSRTLSFEPR